MLKKFIDRPVLATVISIIIVLLGILGLSRLPVTRFPDISPPTVMVSGSYPGGNAQTVIRSVITPLEEQINGVEDMEYIKSTASNDGTFSVTVVFKQGVNPDQAAVNVQNRVQQATPVLPTEVVRMGLTTSKQQNSMIMVFNIYTDDNTKYDEKFIQNYANINLVPSIKRIKGVGQAQIFGTKDYAMRIWLQPRKMASLGIIPADVTNAVADQSLESAPGKIGEESDALLEYVIRYKGKKNTPEDYENIIVKNDGSNIIRLKDVARVEFGSISYIGNNWSNGRNAVTLAIMQTSGSNANEIEIGIDDVLARYSKSFPPGLHVSKIISTKDKLDEATGQVNHTLVEAFILVFIVVFIFLQDLRSTIIPAIAVPVAIVGTFFFLLLLGFTINVLTLFALVLAIGIVVDDAIVVVEAVHSNMEGTTLTPADATRKAMQEITGAVVSVTLVMCAVFIPIGFMSGSAGIFYKQFAYTLVIAILISALNALTLTPALSALFLRNHHLDEQGGYAKNTFGKRFSRAFNASFNNLTNRYGKGVRFLAKNKLVSSIIIVAIIVLAGWLVKSTTKSFVPMEDDGLFMYSLSMPPGTGLQPTNKITDSITKELKKIEAIDEITAISGFNLLNNSAGPAYGMGFVKLKPNAQRGAVKEINAVMGQVSEYLSKTTEGQVMSFRMPPVDGYGVTNDVEVILQDRMARAPNVLKAKADEMIGELMKVKGVQFAYTMFRTDFPQLELEVDEDKAKQLGVSVTSALNTIQTYLSGDQSLNFSRFGKFYRVNIKADANYRKSLTDMNDIFVKNTAGEMIPINTIMKFNHVYGPESVNRYNLYNSLSIFVSPISGVSTGDLMSRIEPVLSKLPTDYSYEWTGLGKEEQSSGNQTMMILGLCLLFVYLLLSAQYESYILPLAVLLSIPTGVIGAFVAVKAVGLDNNIYVQVGLIMLIGLLAKNAILIVEFAVQKRKQGLSIRDAAVDGAKARLRPIIMTSFAFIFGMVPLMFAHGGLATGNKSISISAAMGMLSGVLLGVFVIPILYIFFQTIQEKVSRKKSVVKVENA